MEAQINTVREAIDRKWDALIIMQEHDYGWNAVNMCLEMLAADAVIDGMPINIACHKYQVSHAQIHNRMNIIRPNNELLQRLQQVQQLQQRIYELEQENALLRQ